MNRIRIDIAAPLYVRGHTVVQKMHVKTRLVTKILDVGDFEAGFGRAVGEIGMRIGGGTEGSAVVIAKSSVVDSSLSDIVGTVWPENPIKVRYGCVVEISITVK